MNLQNLKPIQMRGKLKKSLMKQMRNQRIVNLSSSESEMAEDKETEGSQEEETDGENVENETVESNETETNDEVKVI